MKRPYEEPVLRLVGFQAAQKLASDWQWDLEVAGDDEDSGTGSGVDIPYPSNPEGDF